MWLFICSTDAARELTSLLVLRAALDILSKVSVEHFWACSIEEIAVCRCARLSSVFCWTDSMDAMRASSLSWIGGDEVGLVGGSMGGLKVFWGGVSATCVSNGNKPGEVGWHVLAEGGEV